jgi:large subunit ribosomal protein L21
MYAIVRTGAKQYRVQAGDVLEVELLDGDKGGEIALDDVLLIADGDKIQIGKPTIAGARVTAEVIEEDKKGKKVIAFKFRRREGYHRKRGIRPHHTVLKIKEIQVK